MINNLKINLNNITAKIIISSICLLSNPYFISASSASSYVPEHKVYEHQTVKLINSKPQNEENIGIIPYVKKDNEIYILLGRERVDGTDKNAAGRYNNLGSRAKAHETFLENILYKLKEESMGLLVPDAKYILDHNILINHKNTNNQQNLYALVYIEPAIYVTAEQFSDYRYSKKNELSEDELKKDEFVWLKLNELIELAEGGQLTGKITNIEGRKLEISLTKYFVDNFLLNNKFEKLKF